MAGKHSSLPWARTFGIINKNAVTISRLEFFILLVWSNQLEKKLGLHIYILRKHFYNLIHEFGAFRAQDYAFSHHILRLVKNDSFSM